MPSTREYGAAGEREIPEKTRRPTASSGTIPTCENPVTRPEIDSGSPLWEASRVTAQPPRPLNLVEDMCCLQERSSSDGMLRMEGNMYIRTPTMFATFPTCEIKRITLRQESIPFCLVHIYADHARQTERAEQMVVLVLPLCLFCAIGVRVKQACIEGCEASRVRLLRHPRRDTDENSRRNRALGNYSEIYYILSFAWRTMCNYIGETTPSVVERGDSLAALNIEVSEPMRVSGVSMQQRWNERAGETQKSPRKPADQWHLARTGIEPGSPWWEARGLTAQRPYSPYNPPPPPGCGGVVVRLIVLNQREPGSIPSEVLPGFPHVGIVPDVPLVGEFSRGFLGFPRPFIPALLRAHIASPSSALKISLEVSAEQRRNARAGGRDIPEKTRRPAVSSGTIPTCENPRVTPPGIEFGLPCWEASSLTIKPPRPRTSL
ncbi:hypothetical protein PR048_018985 [Dryococelus australis]|uniref:Uncharacterized protein n=1 Tax=Dryococelus australis TaxID=614101 RepID=A0ABQ9H2C3_9NEOP|nr:hypothetical protein PR048_018985 [Dryococelus australis]